MWNFDWINCDAVSGIVAIGGIFRVLVVGGILIVVVPYYFVIGLVLLDSQQCPAQLD